MKFEEQFHADIAAHTNIHVEQALIVKQFEKSCRTTTSEEHDSNLYCRFTPKCIIVGVEERVSEFKNK